MKKIYSSYKDLPRLTEKGFEKIKIPSKIWEPLKQMYLTLKQLPPEKEIEDSGMLKNSIIYPMWQLDALVEQVHNDLIPIFEWWCKESLEVTVRYGLRSYFKGAILKKHKDWINTHHVSSIMVLDKNLDGKKDWPLQFQDHNGLWHDIYLNPGDMLLYESATCEHGREVPFQGKNYVNCYFHSRLKSWDFLPVESRFNRWNKDWD